MHKNQIFNEKDKGFNCKTQKEKEKKQNPSNNPQNLPFYITLTPFLSHKSCSTFQESAKQTLSAQPHKPKSSHNWLKMNKNQIFRKMRNNNLEDIGISEDNQDFLGFLEQRMNNVNLPCLTFA